MKKHKYRSQEVSSLYKVHEARGRNPYEGDSDLQDQYKTQRKRWTTTRTFPSATGVIALANSAVNDIVANNSGAA